MGKHKLKVNKKVVESRQMTLFPDVSPEITYRNEDDMYHCCRWCKHYIDGVCKEIEVEENTVEQFIEGGEVSEVVKESFSDMKFTRFQDFLKSNTRLSEKMVHEAMYRIHSDLDQAKVEWIEEIVSHLSIFFRNNMEDKYFVPPDINTFYCNKWE